MPTPLAMIPKPQPRKPKKRRRVQWTVGMARTQSILHFLIAPYMGWLGARFLDKFLVFLVGSDLADAFSPLSSSNMGYWLSVGLLIVLLIALLALGLWNRRAWALQIATALYGVIAIAAFGSTILILFVNVLVGGCSPTAEAYESTSRSNLAMAGLSFRICIVASCFLLWFCRFRNPEK